MKHLASILSLFVALALSAVASDPNPTPPSSPLGRLLIIQGTAGAARAVLGFDPNATNAGSIGQQVTNVANATFGGIGTSLTNLITQKGTALTNLVFLNASTNHIKHISGFDMAGRTLAQGGAVADYAGELLIDDGGSLYVANSTSVGDFLPVGLTAGIRNIGSVSNMAPFTEGFLHVYCNGNPTAWDFSNWPGDGGISIANMNIWQSGATYFVASMMTDPVTGRPAIRDPVAGGFAYVPTNRFWTPAGRKDSAGEYILVFNNTPGVSNCATMLGIARSGYGPEHANYEVQSFDLDNHVVHFGQYLANGAFNPVMGGWVDLLSMDEINGTIGANASSFTMTNGSLRITGADATNAVIVGNGNTHVIQADGFAKLGGPSNSGTFTAGKFLTTGNGTISSPSATFAQAGWFSAWGTLVGKDWGFGHAGTNWMVAGETGSTNMTQSFTEGQFYMAPSQTLRTSVSGAQSTIVFSKSFGTTNWACIGSGNVSQTAPMFFDSYTTNTCVAHYAVGVTEIRCTATVNTQ